MAFAPLGKEYGGRRSKPFQTIEVPQWLGLVEPLPGCLRRGKTSVCAETGSQSFPLTKAILSKFVVACRLLSKPVHLVLTFFPLQQQPLRVLGNPLPREKGQIAELSSEAWTTYRILPLNLRIALCAALPKITVRVLEVRCPQHLIESPPLVHRTRQLLILAQARRARLRQGQGMAVLSTPKHRPVVLLREVRAHRRWR